ncbi:hypothetical protein [Flavobacterium sp. 3-210]
MVNWIITAGSAKVDDGEIIYMPKKGVMPDGAEFNYITIVNSNIHFENGVIKFTVKTQDPYALAQTILATDKGDLNIGMNTMGYLFGMVRFDRESQRWESPEGGAFSDSFEPQKLYDYEIRVEGSVITLFVNGVKIAEKIQEIKKGQVRFYLRAESEIIISNIQVSAMQPTAFIVMQFTSEYNQLYTEVIKPVCENFGFKCERADEFYTTTPIIADVVKSIINSTIIIAEITPDNPNVYYELGYAHAINKPTILLCDRKKKR